MFQKIKASVEIYTSELEKISSGQSFAVIAYAFYPNLRIDQLVEEGKPMRAFQSQITWLDAWEAYREHGGISKKIAPNEIPGQLMEYLGRSWEFNKAFNPSAAKERSDEKGNQILTGIGEIFKKMQEDAPLKSEEIYIDAMGYDYRAMMVESPTGLHFFEFSHFID